jgi:hypothetical protein
MEVNQSFFDENALNHRETRLTVKLERLYENHLARYTL